MSIDFNNVPVKEALDKLSFLSGQTFRVGSGDAEMPVSLSLQEVTLREIVNRISEQTSTKIAYTGKEHH